MTWKKFVAVGVAALLSLLLLVNASDGVALIGAFVLLIGAIWWSETSTDSSIPHWEKGVLITGCDTGFGHELAHHLDSLGVHVYAGCLNSESEGAKALKQHCSERLHVLQLDITKDEQVNNALAYIKEHLPRSGFWGVVNNAGLNFLGETELCTMEQYERVININVLGMVRITKACLPLLRKYRGRIVNVSSVKGLLYMPFMGPYGASKWAVESFSDTLRMELHKWGISVSIIEPCNYGGATKAIDMDRMRADFTSQWSALDDEQRETYGQEYLDTFPAMLEGAIPTAKFDLHPVINAMTDALFDVKPKTRYLVPGGKGLVEIYRWMALITPWTPTWLMDIIVRRWTLKSFPKPKALQPKKKGQ